MCGIFGYLGDREAAPLLLEGLARLEYRGYDSAGVAVMDGPNGLAIRRAPGKLRNLVAEVESHPLSGTRGLGHTRWATHGRPTQPNAHPHTDCTDRVVVVHNGIVENYRELKERLVDDGHQFSSDTDSEVIAHLVEARLAEGDSFPDAVRLAADELRGAHAIASLYAGEPDILVTFRIGHAGGVCVGYSDDEVYLASDLPALLPLTNSIAFLPPGQMAVLQPGHGAYFTLAGEPVENQPRLVTFNPLSAAKGGYKHFMLKEIMEQPEAAMSALRGRLSYSPQEITLDEVPFTQREIRDLERVVFIGMGTSLHAAHVGAQMIETLARLPATAENSSEFRYRNPVMNEKTLVVAMGQSGETADTLEGLQDAISGGGRTLTICNVEGSQATRMAQGTILMHAGPEVGVASSKTFTASMVCLYLLAAYLGAQRGAIDQAALLEHKEALSQGPALLGRALELNLEAYGHLAARYSQVRRFLFIGRGLLEPLAREGAMKLKEISYLHAEGLPAAELKHGPIALVDPETPVVALALDDPLYEKLLRSISEVKAREGPVLAIATEGNQTITEQADAVLWVPSSPPLLAPLVAAVPLQLFAYHMAVYRGCDVDQPRNLAKSVTVE